MAARTARLYYNTGFNPSNVPDSPSLLNSCLYTDLQQHWDYQDYFLGSIKIGASWDTVKNADYLKYGNGYYFVTGIEMINENNAKLYLQLDALTTMGGPLALQYEGGLIERAWIPNADFWENNHTPEGITPVSPIELESLDIVGTDSTDSETIIISTLALNTPLNNDGTPVNADASEYKVPIAGTTIGSVIVPNSPKGAPSTTIGNTDVGLGYYILNQDVKDQIAYLRSLGLEQAIVGCYTVPTYYLAASTPDSTGHISTISPKMGKAVDITGTHGNYHTYPSGTTHLKKSYQMYTKYYAVSNITGEIKEYDPHDLVNSSGHVNIQFNWMCDGNIKSMPVLYPMYYRGTGNTISNGSLLDTLAGASWMELPITITGASGSLWTKNDYVRNQYAIGLDTVKFGADSIIDVVKNITPGGLGGGYVQEYEGQPTYEMPSNNTYGQNISTGFLPSVGNFLVNSAKMVYRAEKIDTDFAKSQIAAPTLSGSSAYGLQLTLNNNWTIYRSYMSNLDLTRFDKYFNSYGYTINEPLEANTDNIFNNRADQNYVKLTNVHIKPSSASNYGIGIKQIAEKTLNDGVRIWHRLPSTGIDTLIG